MLRPIIIAAICLIASTAQAKGYGRSYCNSCYAAPVVQKVVQQPYDVTNIGNLNQFYSAAPYAQQYPVTDAAYTAAVAEQIQYNLQAVNDQVAQLRSQSQQRLVLVVPQVQAYAVQTEAQTTTHCPTPQPEQPTQFSMTQKQQSLIGACASCHDAGKKAQKHFDMSGPLDCDQQKAALLAVYAGKMPKGRPVQWDEDQFAQFSDELGAWRQQEPEPQLPTPPQDAPEPAGDTAAPDEDFSKAINKAGMKLAGKNIVLPRVPQPRK